MAKLGGEAGRWPSPSSLITGYAPQLSQCSSFPTGSSQETRRHKGNQPPLGCHDRPLSLLRARQISASHPPQEPIHMVTPPSSENNSAWEEGQGGKRWVHAELLHSSCPSPPEMQLSRQPRLRTQAALPAEGSQKGCSTGTWRSWAPDLINDTALLFMWLHFLY